MVLTGRWQEFRRLGLHIVPTHRKSNLVQPLITAQKFGIPAFVLFDADGNDLDRNGERKAEHKRDNEALLSLLGVQEPIAFPAETVWADHYVMWRDTIEVAVEAEIPAEKLQKYKEAARANCGHGPNLVKNSLFIGEFLRLAFEGGTTLPCLERLCETILTAAQR